MKEKLMHSFLFYLAEIIAKSHLNERLENYTLDHGSTR